MRLSAITWLVVTCCLTVPTAATDWPQFHGPNRDNKSLDKGFEVTGRLKIKDPGRNPTWAHPVVCGGRLYIRYGDKVGVYNVIER